MDVDKLAIEAEADRLSGVYIRMMMLARAKRVDLVQAGRDAVAKGLISQGHAVLAWRPEPIRRRVSGASVR